MRLRISRLVAIAALASAAATDSSAQLRVLDLAEAIDVQPRGSRILDTAAAADGSLWILTTRTDVAGSSSWQLHRLSPALEVADSIDLPGPFSAMVQGFGEDALLVRSLPPGPEAQERGSAAPRYELVSIATDRRNLPTSLFVFNDYPGGQFAATPDGTAVYVVTKDFDGLSRYRIDLDRIGRDGRVHWHRELPPERFLALAAVADGVVVAQSTRRPTPESGQGAGTVLLTMFDDRGNRRASIAVPFDESFWRLVYLPPGQVVIAAEPQDGQRTALRVVRLADGETRSLESEAYRVDRSGLGTFGRAISGLGVLDGRLVYAAQQLPAPHLGFIDPVSGAEEAQRFSLLREPGNAGREVYGQLELESAGVDGAVLIASWRVPDAGGGDEQTVAVAWDGTLETLAAAYGDCLAADPLPILRLQREILSEFGILVVGRSATEDAAGPNAENDCAMLTDAAQLEFLDNFRAELRRLDARKWQYRDVRISVAVDASLLPPRLLTHSLLTETADAPDSVFSYAAGFDQGAAMARRIEDVVAPYYDATAARLRDIGRLTGISLSVASELAPVTGEQHLLALEQASIRLLAELERLTSEERRWLEARRRPAYFVLGTESFGPYDRPRPLADARATLLETLGYPGTRP